jgi:hypothetical protein
VITSHLQKAIDGLLIQDVYLRSSQSSLADDFDPKYGQHVSSLTVQQMQIIKQIQVAEIDSGGFLTRVFVLMGNRWVEGQEVDKHEPNVQAVIEAVFVSEYLMPVELEQECLDEFAQKNAIVHVWPYWREYLSSQCDRLRLPRLVMPTLQLAHHKSIQPNFEVE